MSRLAREITYKSLLRFAAPTILSFVFLNIYFIIDGILVSRTVGTAGLAAVNITMPFFGVMLALATMMNTGGSALIASLIGEGKLDTARKGFSFLLLSCVAGSALLAALALLFLRPLVGILGADAGLLISASGAKGRSFWCGLSRAGTFSGNRRPTASRKWCPCSPAASSSSR